MEKRLIDDTSISVVQRSNVRFVSSPSVLLIYLVQSYISLNTIYPFTNGKWNSILTSSEIMLIAYIQNFYSWKLTSKLFLFYFSSAVIHQRHQSCRLHRRAGQLFARHNSDSIVLWATSHKYSDFDQNSKRQQLSSNCAVKFRYSSLDLSLHHKSLLEELKCFQEMAIFTAWRHLFVDLVTVVRLPRSYLVVHVQLHPRVEALRSG